LGIRVIDIPDEYRPAIEELPGDLQRIAEHIELHRPGRGVEITLLLAQIFRGQNLYIRNIDYLLRQIRDDAIRAEYDRGGVTGRELATRWGLSQRMVEKILASAGKEDGRQLNLF